MLTTVSESSLILYPCAGGRIIQVAATGVLQSLVHRKLQHADWGPLQARGSANSLGPAVRMAAGPLLKYQFFERRDP